MPVSCHICGRDFGTRSISIHIPQCVKKWETAQKKLPKEQRRPPPATPADLEKVISGELKGDQLNKYNSQTLEDWNTAALETCAHCGRTFLPSSLKVHQRSCTADKPMVKHSSQDSHASKQKALVNYPKFKTKTQREEKEKREERKDERKEEEKFQLSRPRTYTVETSVEDITRLIASSTELEDPRTREELMEVIQQFLGKRRSAN